MNFEEIRHVSHKRVISGVLVRYAVRCWYWPWRWQERGAFCKGELLWRWSSSLQWEYQYSPMFDDRSGRALGPELSKQLIYACWAADAKAEPVRGPPAKVIPILRAVRRG